jgi:hypothetical protein
MDDLLDGMRVWHVAWAATGTIRKSRGRTEIRFDPPARGGLDVSPAGPVRPSDLEIIGTEAT